MKIFLWNELEEFACGKKKLPKELSIGSVVTIGNFDGFHVGHRFLFDEAKKIAKKKSLALGVITFRESFAQFFKAKKNYAGDVATLNQKLDFFSNDNFDFAIVIDFSMDFATMSGSDFLNVVLAGTSMHTLVEGNDFTCGNRGSFGKNEIANFANEKKFDVVFLNVVFENKERVSSSLIRECVLNADFLKAKKMLLRNYALDASDFLWNDEMKIAREKCKQVLPKNGSYDVAIFFEGGKIKSKLSIDSHFLRLENTEASLKKIKSIEFLSR